jgi:hypothetical protein
VRNFAECVLWGNLSSDKASDQYPTEKVCKSCIRAFDKPGKEIIVSVGRELGQLDESECFFADRH